MQNCDGTAGSHTEVTDTCRGCSNKYPCVCHTVVAYNASLVSSQFLIQPETESDLGCAASSFKARLFGCEVKQYFLSDKINLI